PAENRTALAASIRRHGYKNIEELVRWRLYTRTGGGLMAELGSHHVDACSIFLRWPDNAPPELRGKKKRPLSVTAVGGTHFYGTRPGRGAANDDREVEDHVYCVYDFPGDNFDFTKKTSRKNDIVTVTYSSISTNG